MYFDQCPLCHSSATRTFHQDKVRAYYRCEDCRLVFASQDALLSSEQEKSHYDLHENDVNDAGYRRFLSRLADPLLQRLPRDSSVLEFGCGPGPALAKMLKEAGMKVSLYDHFYFPDNAVFDCQYDAITATEVVEHLFQPGKELQRLLGCLKPGGLLGIMTKRVLDEEAFARWHYIRDPTHVVFFSDATFAWLAKHFQSHIEYDRHDVIIFRKGG